MNEELEPGKGQLRRRDEVDAHPSISRDSPAKVHTNGHSPPKLDVWTFADIIAHRWHWLVIGGILGSAVMFEASETLIKPKFTATSQLLRYETPATSDTMRTTPLTSETFAGLITSPDLLRRVGQQVNPPVPPERLIKQMKVDPQPESDMVKVLVAARDPQQAVDLANLLSRESVAYTKELQANQAAEVANNYLKKQLFEMDKDIGELQDKFRGLPVAGSVTNKLAQISGDVNALNRNLASSLRPSPLVTKLAERLNNSLAEFSELTAKYTDAHPRVQEKQAEIDSLKGQISQAYTNQLNGTPSPSTSGIDGALAFGLGNQALGPDHEIIQAKLRSLEDARIAMVSRQREAELYASDPPGIVRVFAPATLKTVESNHRRIKIGLTTLFGGLLGMCCALLLIGLTEAVDSRLRTAADVKRVTRLPVLTTLGDLNKMRDRSREQWAFRTWTMLQGRLSRSQNHGLVCGITSSTEGEGRSTWISLLAEAASLSGFRVLTIATRPSPSPLASPHEITEGTLEAASGWNGLVENPHALTSNVLAAPAQVTDQLTDPNSQPIVHIPLPGWVWNLERRKQWRDALEHWRRIDNLVIFVELPPASMPEAVLLGSNLPNLLWLTDSGAAEASETRTQLETLRYARCNLVGAILNREFTRPIKRRFSRWLSCFALFAVLSLCSTYAQQTNLPIDPPTTAPAATVPAPASPATAKQMQTLQVLQTELLDLQSKYPDSDPRIQEKKALIESVKKQISEAQSTGTATSTAGAIADAPTTPGEAPAIEPNRTLTFSVVNPAQRAAWQKSLTLGPGDVLTIGLYGEPLLTRADITVGPDGRISYQEAHDVQAAGLTVDELRLKLDEELRKYRRVPRTMVTPVTYRSKKYFMLGKVVQRGVYTLDRPTTVIEALARAHGIESGLVENNTVDLADFSRSFLMRGGKRISLNFEKLLQSGDLSQNLQIEPGDYLYFPSANIQQVYVLGEVSLPGLVTYRPDLTAMAAISARGGFNRIAYKSKVLVVRGSLNQPQSYIVDGMDVMNGRAPDFKLFPKDIVYVTYRPFYRVEELLDLAITAFIQAAIATGTGVDGINVVFP